MVEDRDRGGARRRDPGAAVTSTRIASKAEARRIIRLIDRASDEVGADEGARRQLEGAGFVELTDQERRARVLDWLLSYLAKVAEAGK